MERPTPTPREGLPIGRAALLGTFVAGVARHRRRAGHQPHALERRAERARPGSPTCCPGLGGGWRIYSVQYPLPRFDPKTFELRITGLVEKPQTLRWSEVAELPGERQISDFHCVTGWSVEQRALGGHPAADDHRPRAPEAGREVRHAAVARDALRRPGLARAVPRARRDARAQHMDGKPLTRSHGAPLRLVLPSMYGYKNVKWVRELRFDADADARLLGAARLRHRRLGRQVERLWLERAASSASRAPSARRTGCWPSTFFVMLFTGLCLSVSAFEGILDRPTAKAWHIWSAVVLAGGLVLIVLLGNRRALARSAREIDRFDGDDGRWLRGAPRRVWNGRRGPAAGPLQRRAEAQRRRSSAASCSPCT